MANLAQLVEKKRNDTDVAYALVAAVMASKDARLVVLQERKKEQEEKKKMEEERNKMEEEQNAHRQVPSAFIHLWSLIVVISYIYL